VTKQADFGEPLPEDELRGNDGFGTRITRREDVVWLAMGGELDVFTAPQLRSALGKAAPRPRETLVLDLRGLSFIDSSGLAVILGAHEQAIRDGRPQARIVIQGSAPVEALFHTIGASDYLEMVDDLEELGVPTPAR
jgi:anti-sigma B factor antagonist